MGEFTSFAVSVSLTLKHYIFQEFVTTKTSSLVVGQSERIGKSIPFLVFFKVLGLFAKVIGVHRFFHLTLVEGSFFKEIFIGDVSTHL